MSTKYKTNFTFIDLRFNFVKYPYEKRINLIFGASLLLVHYECIMTFSIINRTKHLKCIVEIEVIKCQIDSFIVSSKSTVKQTNVFLPLFICKT